MKLKLLLIFIYSHSVSVYSQIDSSSIKMVETLINSYYDVTYKNPDSALIILDSAEALAKRTNYNKGVTMAIRLKGLFFSERGEYVKSMTILIDVLKQDEKIKNDDGIAMDQLYLGLNYYYQEKTNEALAYFKKAQQKYLDIKDEAGLTLVNANIGMVYRNLNQYEIALTYYFSVRDYYQKEHIDRNLSRVENNIGNIYKDLKQFDKALSHFKTSENITLKLNETFYLINVWCNVADVYVEKKEFQKAIESYLKALEVAKQQKSVRLQKDVHLDLAHVYEKKSDFKSAYENYKKYSELKDSVISEKYNKDLADMEVKYNSEKKESENKILKKDNELQEIKFSQEKKQKVFFAFIAFLFFLAGAMIFIQYRNKRKLNNQLAQINERVNNQNSTLRTLNKELIESEVNLTKANTSKDQLLSILSHDLYNPVTAVINFTNQIVDNSDKMDKKELQNSLLKVNSAVLPLQDLLDNILQWARTHKSKLHPSFVELNINQVVDEIIQLYQPVASFKSIKIVRVFSEIFVLKTDRLMLYFILRNIINNAVKFCSTGKQISIDIEQSNQRFLISIKDEGNGFDFEIMEQLNKENQDDLLISTHGSGIGLSVSRQFVKLLNGKIEFRNSKEGGGEVKLSFPVI